VSSLAVAVVVPAYRVKDHILNVLAAIGPEVQHIFVIDDCCPDGSGRFVEQSTRDARVTVVRHEANQGVGGAVVTGIRAALEANADIIIKVDGDGQMDPRLIPRFLRPLFAGEADYAKGNRFHTVAGVRAMPAVRSFGNVMLSFLTKLSSGYWSIFDPTNGYVAIHRAALRGLDLSRLSKRYFFESDMLVRLCDVRAVVIDVPMRAVYGTEVSHLQPGRVLVPFFFKHMRAFLRRVLYFYFLRDFNLASLAVLFGLPMFIFGILFGAFAWGESLETGTVATTGTVMVAVLPIVLGFQLLMFFLSYDIASEPRTPLQKMNLLGAASREEPSA
jgi:dolichol-phosphate mannosyltransferase